MNDMREREEKRMKDNKKFKMGQEVWVVERDCGVAVEVSCVLFLAKSKGCIIASAFINDYDFDEIIENHIEETAENYETNLLVYPIDDCFETKEEAEQVLNNRLGGAKK